MGGHGGLNILPQKSWNVYNIKNQNIVRRDEERFRQEQAEAERQARREQAEVRLSKLREGHAPAEQRFNLFEEEEKKANEYEKKRRQTEIEKKEKDKDTWYLGKTRPINPWYERPTKLDDQGPEVRRRSEVDPMALMNSLLSKPESNEKRYPEASLRDSHKKHREHRRTESDDEARKKTKKHRRSEKDESDSELQRKDKKHRSKHEKKRKHRRSRSPSNGNDRKTPKKHRREDK